MRGERKGSWEGVRRAHTGWEEGKGGWVRPEAEQGRRREGETRALFLRSVPFCSPAVSTPTGEADAMSDFDHLSSSP